MYEVDKTKNTIIVYYDGRKTDLDTIRTTIAAMGYDADDIKANSEARDELFNCCKKA